MLEIEGQVWKISVEGSEIKLYWHGLLPRPEAIKFHKSLAEQIAKIGGPFGLEADFHSVPTHNEDCMDTLQLFFERLKVTSIEDLRVIATNNTAKLKIQRLIKSIHFNRRFSVFTPVKEEETN